MDSLRDDNKEFMKSVKLISKSQQRFRSEKHNGITEEVMKTALSANDDKSKYIYKKVGRKYNQKLLDHAKQSATDTLKTTSKRVIQKNSGSNW